MSVTTTYENIAMIVGIEAAQIIVSEFGGTELYIPHVDNLKNDHKLIGSLGIDTAKRLCRYWHGQVLNVPLNKKAEIVKRNQQIIALAKSGECPNRLATKFALHVRTIRKIIEKDIRDRANAVYARSQFRLFD
ncbi:Mor transcription activator family protein [Streptococcus pyogenes]|jgi:hypothetical protein|nr:MULTISPECIES: Mor transcription activator family protein [unclassified Moraxella]HCN16236.1 hypothetical protein [Moraxellaceae bacterium]